MSWRASCVSSTLLVALAACTFDEGANDARGCDERCAPGSCYLGYCLQTIDDPATGGQAGSTAGTPTLPGQGGADTAAGGSGGSATPTTGSSGAAAAGAGGSSGAAAAGGSSGGVVAAPGCAAGMPVVESCNGLDDDCDGALDEDAAVSCYPSGVTGCALGADGAYACTGLCAPGVQACANGSLGPCEGAMQPTDEACGGAEALDEDCDGAVDDDCPCVGAATQRCYGGRAFSAGVGICRAGTQRCVNGQFGACEGEVVPAIESCTNQGSDDDCDLFVDDVVGVGLTCFDWGQQGVCGVGRRVCSGGVLACATPEPEDDESACDGQDEDCDGDVDEDFDLDDDPDHCGGCGIRCAAGALCCGGSCRDPKTDPLHCGGCGHSCGSDTACCDGACVATNTVTHCGGCGACELGQECCGGGCVATDTTDHCGGCDACELGQECCGGHCVTSSSDGGLACP